MNRCPHYILHGQAEGESEQRKIVYYNRCGLKIREGQETACVHYPFPRKFNHTNCEVYHQMFKSSVAKNNVMPTGDIFSSSSLGRYDNSNDLKTL